MDYAMPVPLWVDRELFSIIDLRSTPSWTVGFDHSSSMAIA
jgi:hypothetical protein